MNKESEKTGGISTKVKETAQEVRKVTPARALSPFEEMDRVFDRFFHRGWLWPLRRELPSWRELAAPFEGMMPRVDVIDRDAEIVVKAEVPGVKKEDLDVSVTDNAITIKGSSRHEEKEEKGEYYRCEISRGSFVRTVALPDNVDSSKAKATFKDGILELVMPKREQSKRRTITVE
jgi:HSP20 family protein